MGEIKPCPACENTRLVKYTAYENMRYVSYVKCKKCHLVGSYCENITDAIAAWNALPRRLKWTQEKPTEQGHYWYRPVDSFNGKAGRATIEYVKSEDDILRLPNGEWAGPIPEPEE